MSAFADTLLRRCVSTQVETRRGAPPSEGLQPLAISACLLLSLCSLPTLAQTPPQNPLTLPAGQTPPRGGPPTGLPPGPLLAQPPDTAKIYTDDPIETDGDNIRATNIRIELGEYMLTGGQLSGAMSKELVFGGNPTLTYRGQTITGDTIRFSPRTKTYRVENLHTALTPEFLRGRLLSPLYVSAEDVFGTRRGPIIGENADLTTCDKLRPDYLIRAGQITVEPGKRIILRRATLFLWGVRIITLPTIIIPLDRRPQRIHSNYFPSVGHSADEGWFVKSAFNYLLADRAPGIYRLDLMEKKGVGLGVEQDWNLAKAIGLFALYGIPTGAANKNLSGRLTSRLNLGGGETIDLGNDFQQNSYLSLPQTTNINSRFGFNRLWEGYSTNINISRQATESQSSTTHSYTANLAQGFQLGRTANLNLNADYSRYASLFTSGTTSSGQLTQQLSTRLQADQRASNYTLQLSANKNVPIGERTGQSFFSGVEKLPELSLSNFRFLHGPLSKVPATFLVSVGDYSEGGTVGTGNTQGRISEQRGVFGFDLNNNRFRLSPRTDLNVSAGFQQYLYSGGAAQYVLRDTATLTQRWNRRSGLNFNYTYQRPEGGTPFRFDQQGQFHALNADLGLLDDRHLQLTARVGYDFAQTGFGGFKQPWQTLSANLLARPVDWMRLQNLFAFDPNTGKFLSVTSDLRFRGHNDFALDVVSRYDPQRHTFGNINSYLDLPIGKLWRVIALLQYNGYLSRFESRNVQFVWDLHCMEASLTYIDNPFGFRNDRQIFFQLRIKAFPTFQRFGVGQFGQALDPSVGGVY